MPGSFLNENEPNTTNKTNGQSKYHLLRTQQPVSSEEENEINHHIEAFQIDEITPLAKEFEQAANSNVLQTQKLNRNNNSRSNLSLIQAINSGFHKMVNRPSPKANRHDASRAERQKLQTACLSTTSSNCESDSESGREMWKARRSYSKDSMKSSKPLISKSSANQNYTCLFILVALTLLVNFPLGFVAMQAALKARKTKNLHDSRRYVILARQYCFAGAMVAAILSSLALLLFYINTKFSFFKLDHSNPGSLQLVTNPTLNLLRNELLTSSKASSLTSKPSKLSHRIFPASIQGSQTTNKNSLKIFNASFNTAKEFKAKVYDRISILIDRDLSR